MSNPAENDLNFDYSKYGFRDEENYAYKSAKGLNEEVVRTLSKMKGEPEWMLQRRLKALEIFNKKPLPVQGTWANPELAELDFQDIYYYVRPGERAERDWDDVPESIKNTFERLGIPEAERKFLAGVGAQYECLSGDSRVFTNKGLVPIRDIQPGDVVYSFDEEANQIIAAEVRATAEKGEREVFEVRVGTRRIKATSNHPFLTLAYAKPEDRQRGRYTRTWKYLHELQVGDLVAVAKDLPDTGVLYELQQPEIKTTVIGRNQAVEYELDISSRYNDINLPEHTTDDLMWWLGLYIGDGFIHYTKNSDKARVEFAIPDTDAALRDELVQATERIFGIATNSGDQWRVAINSTIMARFLEANGFEGKALEKRVPRWVFGLPQSQKLAFLGGYLDSDGYIRDNAKNHDVMLTSGNHDLLHDMAELLALCGLPTSSIHKFESKHPTEPDRLVTGYRIQVAGDYERIASRSPRRQERMGKRKYHHDYSSAKGTTFRSHVTEFHGFVKIDSITPAGVEMVYDIEVDGPHNFVAEGLIVHNSEVVYHSLREEWEKLGVIFLDMDSGLREHPEIIKEYFGTVIPSADNKFAALNTAVWSGGSFVYVPKGVKVDIPLQAYFRINAENMGQFERTLIIIEEGAEAHYIEGCFTAGARVRTRQGEKAIEDIQVGDEVLTHKGRYRKVYNTMRRPYQGKLYSLRYFGDSTQTLNVTEEHPLLVVRRDRANERNRQFQPEWMLASMVKQGDYLAIPIAKPESQSATPPSVVIPFAHGRSDATQREISFAQEPDFYRLLGYYFAEGHVSNEHYLTLSFHVNEQEYLADGAELLERYFGKAPIANAERQNGQSLVLCSTEAARAFAYTFGSTAYDKHVPDWVLNAPRELLTQLVRGMWCGDGSYDATKNMFRYNTISRQLAYAFRDALLRLGVVASINYQERGEPRQPMYTVVVSSPCNPLFGDIVGVAAPAGSLSGSPFQLDEHYLYVPIREIVVDDVETEVFNFSVEEDESYVAEGVVSHNCTAPVYTTNSLHSAVVEIIVKKGGKCRYTTIQNWAPNIFNLVTKRAVAYEEASMEWVDGNIGCLAEGSTVTTPAGIKPIEALEPGEEVLSYDDQSGELVFRRVLAKRFTGQQPVHTVAVGERALHVTANHPFYSYTYDAEAAKKSGRYSLAYVRADHLEEAIIPRTSIDYGQPYQLKLPLLETEFGSSNQYAAELTMTRSRESRLNLQQATTDDVMWLFGYWVGDGNIDVKAAQTQGVVRWAKVGFSTPETDRAYGRLRETMAAITATEPTVRADGHHLAWSSKELAELFELNGFTGKALTKRVPAWVWSLPESQRLAFVAGYLDADGSVVASSRRFQLKSANADLLKDIASLLVTLGITSRLHTEFSTPRTVTILGYECTAHGSYRLTLPLDARLLAHVAPALREAAEASPPVQNVHKRTVGRSNIELPESVEIVKVDVSSASAEPRPTWDIEVEGTGNFISQGFIVHNSKLTMKYPAVYMLGNGAKGEVLSVAYAGHGQHQDAGAKMVHAAPNTTSRITNKSVSKGGGRTTYRGLAKVQKGATNAKINVVCDALILDELSASDTIPYIEIEEDSATVAHEATVGKIGEEQLFYLMSRGLDEAEALSMIVLGFMEPFTRELPMEYAVELNRLIQMEMEGSVG